jgi:hypothetical protein
MSRTRLLLRVTCNRYLAGAVWIKTGDGWRCTNAAPILAWMMNLGSKSARLRLENMGASYEWIDLQ